MTIDDLRSWIAENREGLIASLVSGSYQPKTVRGVEIPKPGVLHHPAFRKARTIRGRRLSPMRRARWTSTRRG